MKYAILVGDGMADYPIAGLDKKTPLMVARTPSMDRLAREGSSGMAEFVPAGFSASSDVAILSLLGYSPGEFYAGRGPLESASMGIKLAEDEIAFRCNLITAEDGKMVDYSAGHIATVEAKELIKCLNSHLASESIRFYAGVSYRHLLVVKEAELIGGNGGLRGNEFPVKCYPPHDITGELIGKHLPQGEGESLLKKLMKQSESLLDGHEINQVRRDLGENPANMIWLWGPGKRVEMPAFFSRFGVKGAVISAVDVVKGIANCIGLKVIDVPGTTGYFDTDYEAKARYALQSLSECDLVFVHVEATDEAGHMGDVRTKVMTIEDFDSRIVGPILEGIKDFPCSRILVTPDHPTPISLKTHSRDAVPFVIWGEGISPDGVAAFSEEEAKRGELLFKEGYRLMEYFVMGGHKSNTKKSV